MRVAATRWQSQMHATIPPVKQSEWSSVTAVGLVHLRYAWMDMAAAEQLTPSIVTVIQEDIIMAKI